MKPDGIHGALNCALKTTIPELRSLFDGSEQLVGITVTPALERQVFLT
jgi:hypothetical protein